MGKHIVRKVRTYPTCQDQRQLIPDKLTGQPYLKNFPKERSNRAKPHENPRKIRQYHWGGSVDNETTSGLYPMPIVKIG